MSWLEASRVGAELARERDAVAAEDGGAAGGGHRSGSFMGMLRERVLDPRRYPYGR